MVWLGVRVGVSAAVCNMFKWMIHLKLFGPGNAHFVLGIWLDDRVTRPMESPEG